MLNKRKGGSASFGSIVATIGSILVAIGVAWLIAINWSEMPSLLKVAILISSTALAYISGTILRIRDYKKIGESLLILGALLYTLSIFLIAQIYHLSTSLQVNANLLLLSWAGIFITAYIFSSSSSLLISLAQFLIWVSLQYIALIVKYDNEPIFGIFVMIYLAVGAGFYGLNQLHQSLEHKFANVYKFWAAFYLLLLAYLLSFQTLLPMLWPDGLKFSSSLFFIIISIVAIWIFIIGNIFAIKSKKASLGESLLFVLIIILFTSITLSASFVSSSIGSCRLKSCYDIKNQNQCESINLPNMECEWTNKRCEELNCYSFINQSSCESALSKLECFWQNNTYRDEFNKAEGFCQTNKTYDNVYVPYRERESTCSQYDNNREACLNKEICAWDAGRFYSGSRGAKIPLSLWLLWIIDNIIFLLFILLVIGYGTKYHSPKLVNLGILFFALDIATRYIGFMIDLWGYTSLSILFITGGIILIFGGLLIEKWRRKLIKKTRESNIRY